MVPAPRLLASFSTERSACPNQESAAPGGTVPAFSRMAGRRCQRSAGIDRTRTVVAGLQRGRRRLKGGCGRGTPCRSNRRLRGRTVRGAVRAGRLAVRVLGEDLVDVRGRAPPAIVGPLHSKSCEATRLPLAF